MRRRKRKPKGHKRTKTLKCTSCGVVRESDANEIYHAAGARCFLCGSRMDKIHYWHVNQPQSTQKPREPIRLAKIVIERNQAEQAECDEVVRRERIWCLPGPGLFGETTDNIFEKDTLYMEYESIVG